MDETAIDREAMERLAKALAFICGAEHPTTVALKMAAESGTERDIKNARTLFLSQEEFAAQFHIPIGTLRDWEQGRKEPDAGRQGVPARHRQRAGYGAQGPVAAAGSQTVTPDCGAAHLEDSRSFQACYRPARRRAPADAPPPAESSPMDKSIASSCPLFRRRRGRPRADGAARGAERGRAGRPGRPCSTS